MRLSDFIAKLQEYPPDAIFEEVCTGGRAVTHFNDSRDAYVFFYDKERNVIILSDADSSHTFKYHERIFNVDYP